MDRQTNPENEPLVKVYVVYNSSAHYDADRKLQLGPPYFMGRRYFDDEDQEDFMFVTLTNHPHAPEIIALGNLMGIDKDSADEDFSYEFEIPASWWIGTEFYDVSDWYRKRLD